jgi:hypothetical protein
MRADVTVSRDAGGGVRIDARDQGVGFDPGRIPPDRLGLRESVLGRMEDVGGSATVRSAPGRGTTVVLSWHADGPPAARSRPSAPAVSAAGAPGTAGAAGAVPAGTAPAAGAAGAAEVVGAAGAADVADAAGAAGAATAAARLREDYAAGQRRAVGAVTAVWLVVLLAPLAASWHRYRVPGLAAVMWVVLAAAVVPAVRTLRTRALHRREAALVVLTAIAGAVAVGLDTEGADVARAANWFGVDAVPLLLMLVVTSRPAREWVPAAVLTDAVVLWLGVARAGTEPLALTRLIAASAAVWSLLIVVAAVGPVLRSTAETTARAALAETEVAARRDSARAISRDRRRRRRFLERETVPLLREIAAGNADPRADEVRRACAALAAAVRRRLAASEQPGRLGRLGELEAVVEAAEARGVALDVQVAGDLTRAPAPVRTEITAALDEMVDAVPAGRALLTVFCSAAGGSIYMSFPAVPRIASPGRRTPLRTRLTAVHTEVEDGYACLEVHW